VRRNPVVSALFLIVVMVFTAGTALSTYFAVQADTRARDAEREKERADRQANEAGENARRARAEQVRADAENRMAQSYLYAARMTLLQRAMDNHDVTQAIELFDAQRPERTGGRDLRGFEWFYWQRRCPANRLILKAQSGCVTSVVFSPDGKRLASSTGTTLQPQAPGAVNVWDAVTGGVILTLKKHEKFVRQVCFSPDGRLLASASEDRTVRVWDAATGRELHVLRHRSAVRGVAFSPDGQSLASAAADGTVTLWAVPAGREVRSLAAHRGEALAVSFSPDQPHHQIVHDAPVRADHPALLRVTI
jgi:hypothetical protein